VQQVQDLSFVQQLEERVRAARQLRADERTIAGVAHDLNNALAVVRAHTELVVDDLGATDSADQLTAALRAVERAENLVHELGNLLRPSGKDDTRMDARASADVRELLVTLGPALRKMLGPDVRLEVRDDQADAVVALDPTSLQRVMLNLVGNARDAMPDGGRLTLELGAAAGGAVELVVRDTGVGMDVGTQEHAFQPFFTTKGGDGFGIGLTAVYSLVHGCGGEIDIRSAPGQGTSVRVRLPRS
jgi:signal transduction histidine kinase